MLIWLPDHNYHIARSFYFPLHRLSLSFLTRVNVWFSSPLEIIKIMRTIRVLTHFLKIFYNKGALEPCVDILQMAGARPSFGLVWDTALNPRPLSGIRD